MKKKNNKKTKQNKTQCLRRARVSGGPTNGLCLAPSIYHSPGVNGAVVSVTVVSEILVAVRNARNE